MSQIRFVHTDFLRLATPISGVADTPGWLTEQAAGSVRNAVRNLADTAVNHDADFLIVAGSLTDSTPDLPLVVAWFQHIALRLQESGVQVVVSASTDQEAALLAPVCDIVLRPGELLHASLRHQNVQLRTSHRGDATSEELTISIGRELSPPEGRTVYNAVPGLQCSTDADSHGVVGYLSLAAGAVQAVRPDERGEYGCIVVEADTESRLLKSEFVATDVIRFAQEDLSLKTTMTTESLAAALVSASESIDRSSAHTVILDWRIDAELAADLHDVGRLDEFELLHRIRSAVQSGHRGVWPRRLSFLPSATLRVATPEYDSVQEYIQIVSGAVHSYDVDQYTTPHRLLSGQPGVSPSLISGLSLLGRVA